MNANVYQHFRKDEHPFIDSVAYWMELVGDRYAPYLTDFLDPRQAYILETLVRQNQEVRYAFYGGYEQAERRRCLIFPEYYQVAYDDFEIVLFEIMYPIKFATLSHSQILGALMNLGVKRTHFGDIISDGQRWQVFMAKEIAQFVVTQLQRIGKITVRLEEKSYTELLVPKDEWAHEQMTMSSLRLDTVIAAVYHISRTRAKQLVESGKVKVNWVENKHPDFLLDLLDIVSIRGFGRIQIQAFEGKTKKDKCRLSLGVLRK